MMVLPLWKHSYRFN